MALASHGGPPHPDSPYPGGGQSDAWLSNHAAILIAGVILFVVILAGSIMLGHRHMETTTHTVLTGDKTTASLLAAFIEEHNKATVGILQSYANRPRFIDAVKNKEKSEAGRYLSDLQTNANIDLTFVTDPDGILWINFPHFSEAIGQNLSHRQWYKGISSQWKPYISSVFKLIVADKPLAVAVCVPVHDEKERGVGILASSQRLEFIKETVENQPLFPDSQVSVIDREGQILYSNTYPYRDLIAKHPLSSDILEATDEKKRQLTITRQ
jgi:C4-dicarboxylate-specific signal transduction histidine kinase